MYYSQFLDSLGKKRFSPVYVFFGPEDYLQREALLNLKAGLVLTNEDFNFRVFYGDELKNDGLLLDELLTLPSFGDKKLVAVKKAEKFPPGLSKNLAAILDVLPPDVHLALFCEKIDNRLSLFKAAARTGESVSCGSPKGVFLENWARERFRQRGKSISRDVLSVFLSRAPKNLSSLDNEIEKAALLSSGGEIEAEDLRFVKDSGNNETAGELAECVFRGDCRKSLKIFDRLWRTEKGGGIVGLLHWQIFNIWRAGEYLREGISSRAIAGRLNIFPSRQDSFWETVKLSQKKDIRKILEYLLDGDLALKSGGSSPRRNLEMMIIRLCGA